MPYGRVRFYGMILLLILLSTAPVQASASGKVYTLAVVPNLPAVTLHKNWMPLVDYLSRRTGMTFELKLYDKITTFLDDAKSGQADFIYAPPNMFYLAYQRQKYVPLVRSSQMLRGQVFVRKDSPFTKVSELKGKTIAFVGPRNVCSVITRHAMLTGQGTLDYNTSFSGSTINVAKSVLIGKADAGATLDTSMMNDLPDMQKEFRVILETEKIAPHPFAAHPRVPVKDREVVTAALLAMDKTPAGQRMLTAVKLSHPMKADYQRDYSFFAKVDFEKLYRQQPK